MGRVEPMTVTQHKLPHRPTMKGVSEIGVRCREDREE